jgi:hypothetical protein
MDTTWFAVDKDGQIAAFESSEGGAVPNDALSDQQGAVDPLQQIHPYATSCDVVYALDDQRSPLSKERQHARPQKPFRRKRGRGLFQRIVDKLIGGQSSEPAAATGSTESESEEEMIAPMIMFLNDLQIVEGAIAEGVLQPVKSVRGTAVLAMKLPLDLYRQIHDRNLCTGCYYEFGLESFQGNVPPEYSKMGLFYYVCCEDQMAVPYGRHTVPERPLNIAQLPPELQSELKKVRFTDVSFANTPYIQPAQRVESYAWDGGYLREDWQTFQANPGQEQEYAEFYTNVVNDDYFGDFKLQPPGGSM